MHEQLEELLLTGDETNIELALQLATGQFGHATNWAFYADCLDLAKFYAEALAKEKVEIIDLIRYMRRIGISLDRPATEIDTLPRCGASRGSR